jgi:hypothetical protein
MDRHLYPGVKRGIGEVQKAIRWISQVIRTVKPLAFIALSQNVKLPSVSRRVTRRFPCSQIVSLPFLSSARPFGPDESSPFGYPILAENTDRPGWGFHLYMRWLTMSLNKRSPVSLQTGPSRRPNPPTSFSSFASAEITRFNAGSAWMMLPRPAE